MNEPTNKIWARLGVTVTTEKPLSEYPDDMELADAVIEAVKAGKFEIDGDAYIPGTVLEELADEGLLHPDLEVEGGDLELGSL
jgi:hypothetical protein